MTHWWATDGEMWQRSLSYIGAFPLMYGGGQSTFVSPVRKLDVAQAMARIGGHPDSDGHDFELFNETTFKLAELVEFMFDAKWSSMQTTHNWAYRVPGIHTRKDVDLDLFQYDVLGELTADKNDLTFLQRQRRKILNLHLAKLNWPRFIYGPVRLLDYVKREQSHYYDWTNEDHFNLMNLSDKPTFQNPGFKELGIKPRCPLPTIHESCVNYHPGLVENFKPLDALDHPPQYEWAGNDAPVLAST